MSWKRRLQKKIKAKLKAEEKEQQLAKKRIVPTKVAGGAYGVFLEEQREAIKASLPSGHKITDVAKTAGDQWRALSAEARKPYDDKYQEKMKAYAKGVSELSQKVLDPDSLREASGLGYETAFRKLAARPDMLEKQLPGDKIVRALRAAGGSFAKARNILLKD